MPEIVLAKLIRFCFQIPFGNAFFFSFKWMCFSFNKLQKPTPSFKKNFFFEILVPESEQYPLFTTKLDQFRVFFRLLHYKYKWWQIQNFAIPLCCILCILSKSNLIMVFPSFSFFSWLFSFCIFSQS